MGCQTPSSPTTGRPGPPRGWGGLTTLEAWLLLLGVEPWHGRPHHPQTQGKVERFHGTLAAEVFTAQPFPDLIAAQTAFTRFRTSFNHERPPEALDYGVPATRYHPSPRLFPDRLPEVTYGPEDAVRIVTMHGSIPWQQRRSFVSRGLIGQPVAVRPTTVDGCWEVDFCHRQVATIDLNDPDEV